MNQVVIEVQYHPDSDWQRVGSVAEVEPLGSVQSLEPSGRMMLLFGWNDGSPGVWFSVAGADTENAAVRAIHTLGLERLADLDVGSYVRTVHTAAGQICTRWRVIRDVMGGSDE